MRARLAAVILGRSPVRDAIYAKDAGADMLELRIDQFRSLRPDYLAMTIRDIKRKTHLPIIATLRYRKEEGFLPVRHRINENRRLEILLGILPLVEFVDIELRSEISGRVIAAAHSFKKKVIISYHNFKRTPPLKELTSIARKSISRKADIVKIATFARKDEDVARLMAFTYLCKIRPLITISMGNIGSISRTIAPLFGSCISYVAVTRKTAPGQLLLKK